MVERENETSNAVCVCVCVRERERERETERDRERERQTERQSMKKDQFCLERAVAWISYLLVAGSEIFDTHYYVLSEFLSYEIWIV